MEHKIQSWESNLVGSLIIGWLVTYVFLGKPVSSLDLSNTSQQSFLLAVVLILSVSSLAFLLGRKNDRLQHVLVVATIFIAASLTLFKYQGDFWLLGFALVMGLTVYIYREDVLYYVDKIPFTPKGVCYLYVVLGVLLFSFLTMVGILRYLSYMSEGHDLGIFTQMFEYMRTTGMQNTTLERNRLMSHFEVHVSPIYYVLLPLYMIFRSALTLQISQAVLISVSLYPLYLLCKEYGLSEKVTAFVGICYTIYPALTGSCFNDFHENAFLPLLLFTLIYAVESNKKLLFYVSMILSLMVKEDVSIQLLVLAAFLIFSGKDRKKGWIIAGVSAVYLVFALWLLGKGQEGGVLGYMGNMYLTETGGIQEAVKTILMNPGYTLRQCFATPDKIQYLGWMLIPLGSLLLVKTHFSRYILCLYVIFMNLVPEYGALNNIYRQYHYPVIVFFFYMVIMNAAEREEKSWIREAVPVFVMGLYLFTVSVFQSGLYVGVETLQTRESTRILDEAIAMVPKEASVSASSLLVTHMTDHKKLYGLWTEESIDYILVDYRTRAETEYDEVAEWIEQGNYREIFFEPDIVKVYQKIEE